MYNIESKVNLSIRARILTGLLISSSLMLFVVFLVANNMQKVKVVQMELLEEHHKIERLNKIENYLFEMEIGVRRYLLSGDTKLLEPFNAAQSEFAKYVEETKTQFSGEAVVKIEKLNSLVGEWVSTTAVSEMLGRRKLAAGFIDFDQYMEIFKTSRGNKIVDEANKIKKSLSDEQSEKILALEARFSQIVSHTTQYTVIGILLSLALGFGIQYLITSFVTRKTSAILRQFKEVESAIDESTSELVTNGASLDDANSRLTDSIANASRSVDEILVALEKTTSDAQDSVNFTQNSHVKATASGEKLRRLVESVFSINEQMSQLSSSLEKDTDQVVSAAEGLSKIAENSRLIDDIVFQTKLLSFNASVEAARAGESGKGFAVVAEEIGNLATQSGNASREIASTIEVVSAEMEKSIRDFSSNIKGMIDKASQVVSDGTVVANECEASIEEILSETGKVRDLAERVGEAVHRQSSGVRVINEEVEQVGTVSNVNVQVSKQVRQHAQSLDQGREKLRKSIRGLGALVAGKTGNERKSA